MPAPTIRDFELEKTDPAGPIPLNSNSWARFWIVPKKYVERVGGEGYKKAPVAAGPYRFVSITPGLELTLEAFGQYWRKTPSVKRLVFRAIPDEATRLVALKRGEVDIIYGIRGELAEELARTKGLILQPTHQQWHPLALLRRPVGPALAMARPAGTARGGPRNRPQDHQSGADARPLQAHRQSEPKVHPRFAELHAPVETRQEL